MKFKFPKIPNPFVKWALVKTFKHVHPKGNYTYHIHCFESNKGKRRAEYKCGGEDYDIDREEGHLKTTDLYQEKIYRWLAGRRDPDIPKYSEIDEEDTANFLKGKV